MSWVTGNPASIGPDAVGKFLCHYTTAEAAFAHIIPTRELRFSPFARLQDPHEFRLTFSAAYFVDAAPDAEPAYWQLDRRITKLREARRVLCMTMDATDYGSADFLYAFGWARARLWEHYADRHAGVCLVFDRDRFHGTMIPALHQVGLHDCGPVEYSPRGFYDSSAHVITDDELLTPDAQRERLAQWLVTHAHDLYFRKTEDWQSEHEYRYAVMAPETEYAFASYGSSLLYAVVGHRFPDWQLEAAQAACDRARIELRRMSWVAGQPWPGLTGRRPTG